MPWLLPTKDRPQNLRRFLNSAREMGTDSPGLILVNRDDWAKHKSEYETLQSLAPVNWVYEIVDADSYGGAIRAVWGKVKDAPWIGLVADDLVCCTPNWDTKLIGSLAGWNLVYSNDGWQAPARLHGAILWSGELARTVGWIFPDRLRHIFHDNVWETIRDATGCANYMTDVMCKHLHESLEGVRGPTTDPTSELWKHDQAVFEDWIKTDKDAIVARVQALMTKAGVRSMKPDWTGISIFIGTPTVDGKYESNYLISWWRMMQLLAQNGVGIQFAEEKYTADIALARSKLLAAFLRSPCSHFLMIDADMGWADDAIMRLVCAKKDFVSIAGPKKRYPLSFAANYTDEKGNPVNLQFDQETGTMEIGEIGSAFCLITRACAQRLVQSYPELHYTGITGEDEWGLYIPMVEKGRWYSEDFAFCKRWRNIGGKCHFIPDVALSHTGFHTFSGAFSQTLQAAPAVLKEAAD